jgi:hypothetical protein
MKLISKIFSLLLAGMSIATTSCQKESVEVSNEAGVDEVIMFKGIKVLKPASVPQEVFGFQTNYESAQFLRLLPAATPSAREKVAPFPYAIPVFYETLKRVAQKYPKMDEWPYSEKDLKQISKDFPEIKTAEHVQKNSEVIVAYYDRLIQNDISVELPKLKNTKSGRLRSYDDNSNPYEATLANVFPIAGLCVSNARYDSQAWTNERFGSHLPDSWKGNAFKHAVWNAQGVRKMINSGYGRYESYNLMKLFATAHEQDPNLGGAINANDVNTCMDLHNNAIGRSYMKNSTGWGIFGVRNMPDENEIKNVWEYHCNNYLLYKTTPADILNLTYGNVNALASADYVDFPYGVKIIN